MNGIKYRLLVDNDLAHVWSGRQIDEIFLPDVNLIFNSAGGCFRSDKPRSQTSSGASSTEAVDVPEDDIVDLLGGIEERDKHLAVMARHFAGMDVR